MNNIATLTWSAHEALVDCLTKKSDADRAKAATLEVLDADEAGSPHKTSARRITLLELLAQSLLIALCRDMTLPARPLCGEDISIRHSSGDRVKYSDIPEWERR